ncbi:hypothetical protein JXA85_02015 [Candidatus Woesearchaeota archaeon]|nr:hypothetical protein [Candidatus Woesearchaeota archaeon]
MLEKTLILFFAAILITSVHAETFSPYAEGYVEIEIVNRIPEILSVSLEPNEIYSDSEISCNVIVNDEAPELIKLEKKFSVTESQISCFVVAIDFANQRSPEKTVVAEIRKAPLETRIIKNSLNLLGAEMNTEKTIQLEKKALSAITGFVIKEKE